MALTICLIPMHPVAILSRIVLNTKDGAAQWNKRITNNAWWKPNVMQDGINALSTMLQENRNGKAERESTSTKAKDPQ